MSLGLFTPFLLAGAALMALPWLIHRIRRPERIPTPFSSLMFVPQTKKNVVQRRRIEHWLLMLLRMLGLLLLCFAFSRPYLTALAIQIGDDRPVRHLVLIDTSYSMGTLDWFSQAQAIADDLVSKTGDKDAIGVAVFDSELRVMSPVYSANDPEAGTKSRASEAVARAKVGYDATRYVEALRAAESQLLADVDPDTATETRRILHVITDLQAGGADSGFDSWRVSPLIECFVYPVGERPARSAAIVDSSISESRDGGLHVRVKVRNWSLAEEEQSEIALVAGEFEESQIVAIAPGGTGQAVFDLEPTESAEAIQVSIGPDALDIDNRNYIAWNPEQRPVLGVVEGDETTFSGLALSSERSPWETVSVDDSEALGVFQAMVYTGDETLDAATQGRLGQWVNDGGRLLVQLNADPADWPRALLSSAGVELGNLAYEEVSESQYTSIEWVDLDHEIFEAFRSPRLSDFTPIRFFNYATATLGDTVRAIARFESSEQDDGPPAAVIAPYGDGVIVAWLFHVGLDDTTLPRSPRFVPMLFETLRYLTPSDRVASGYTVGAAVHPPAMPAGETEGTWERAMNEDEPEVWTLADAPRWESPGIARWRLEGEEGWRHIAAVNIDPAESDPARITESEFALKYFSSNTLGDGSSPADAAQAAIGSETVVRNEFGYFIILGLVLWLFLESVYAARLA